MLTAISPLDGRYQNKLHELSAYFSEYGLIKYRLYVEIEYFIHLLDTLPISNTLNSNEKEKLRNIVSAFSISDAEQIKEIEKITNHDVKAVEYFLKQQFETIQLASLKEYIHFALTSQDINNTAIPILLRDFTINLMLPKLSDTLNLINERGIQWKPVAMLARTHGQPATPTTMGKELLVYSERLNKQIIQLQNFQYSGKFGGATGNFNAHFAAFPQIDWPAWANQFLENNLGIGRQQYTTQIAHYDEIAEWCHILIRLNSILIDFCRDIWTYISLEYFTQQTKAGEIGSSAMPHKVNPIDFENAEGNLGISTALATHLAEKLPISRLQRDLTDSTVLRNLGVPIAHTYLSLLSIQTGIHKLVLNNPKIEHELDQQWIILAEAVQTILRREAYENPYETLKDLTRGKTSITREDLHNFINHLNISEAVKLELKNLNPQNYIGPKS
ncbi:MAG: adenylosuccinate lyase [Saprospiraceae bacterium]|nr:adenylosuccinate lyase [Saprospiraceae bacterium]